MEAVETGRTDFGLAAAKKTGRRNSVWLSDPSRRISFASPSNRIGVAKNGAADSQDDDDPSAAISDTSSSCSSTSSAASLSEISPTKSSARVSSQQKQHKSGYEEALMRLDGGEALLKAHVRHRNTVTRPDSKRPTEPLSFPSAETYERYLPHPIVRRSTLREEDYDEDMEEKVDRNGIRAKRKDPTFQAAYAIARQRPSFSSSAPCQEQIAPEGIPREVEGSTTAERYKTSHVDIPHRAVTSSLVILYSHHSHFRKKDIYEHVTRRNRSMCACIPPSTHKVLCPS